MRIILSMLVLVVLAVSLAGCPEEATQTADEDWEACQQEVLEKHAEHSECVSVLGDVTGCYGVMCAKFENSDCWMYAPGDC